jgi:uncharacterized protein (DUF362 family)
MDRRRFLKNCLGSGFGYSLLQPAVVDGRQSVPLLLELISDGLKRINDDIPLKTLPDFLYRSLNQFPDISWENIFASSERVGIKVSCLPGEKFSTSVNLVRAIVSCLKRAGIKSENIIIWERTIRELRKGGFSPESFDCRVIGTDELQGNGYYNNISIHKSIGSCFSRVLGDVDGLISVPILKDHDLSGVSIGMKNFYGAIHNPNKFHANNCNPYIADLCSHPLIRNKLRLVICDASRIQYHNGPAYSPRYVIEYGKLLISTDPVALDYHGWQIIEEQRRRFKLPGLGDENRSPGYILTAQKNGLGNTLADLRVIKQAK